MPARSAPGGRERRRLSATALAQYVRFGNCDRLLSFILHPEHVAALEARWRISPQPLTPLLHATGEAFEQEVIAAIRAAGETVVNLAHRRPEATLAGLRHAAAGRRLVLAQAPLAGEIGGWPCGGTADLIWLVPGPAGPRVTVADVKASLNERVEHRLQVAFYVRLLRQIAGQAGIPLGTVQGAVLHRETGGDFLRPASESPLLPRGPRRRRRPARRVPREPSTCPRRSTWGRTTWPSTTSWDRRTARRPATRARPPCPASPHSLSKRLPFSLSFKCDGCLFNAHCLHESNGAERLALVPHISAAETRLLLTEGIPTFRDLAALTRPAARGNTTAPWPPPPARRPAWSACVPTGSWGASTASPSAPGPWCAPATGNTLPTLPARGSPPRRPPPPPPSRPSTPPSAPSRTRAPTPAW